MADLCHTCSAPIAGYDSVSFGSMETGYRELCSRCFNEEVAERGEIDFQHVNFEPIDMTDATGKAHRFHFRLHLLGDRCRSRLSNSRTAPRAAISSRCSLMCSVPKLEA